MHSPQTVSPSKLCHCSHWDAGKAVRMLVSIGCGQWAMGSADSVLILTGLALGRRLSAGHSCLQWSPACVSFMQSLWAWGTGVPEVVGQACGIPRLTFSAWMCPPPGSGWLVGLCLCCSVPRKCKRQNWLGVGSHALCLGAEGGTGLLAGAGEGSLSVRVVQTDLFASFTLSFTSSSICYFSPGHGSYFSASLSTPSFLMVYQPSRIFHFWLLAFVVFFNNGGCGSVMELS